MNHPNPLLTIQVALSPNAGKPSGYEFRYTSDSPLVAADGNIDLGNFDHDDVDLKFVLLPMEAGQPVYPDDVEDAVWFVKWPKGNPPPPPCPRSPGHANSSFKDFDLPDATTLSFTDKNNDNQRYAYALRCRVPPSNAIVMDDPVIINKIGSGPG